MPKAMEWALGERTDLRLPAPNMFREAAASLEFPQGGADEETD